MIEAKGPRLAHVLTFEPGRKNLEKRWLVQSLSQVESAGKRKIIWYFAERYAADYARRLFVREDHGRERIAIKVVPAVMK